MGKSEPLEYSVNFLFRLGTGEIQLGKKFIPDVPPIISEGYAQVGKTYGDIFAGFVDRVTEELSVDRTTLSFYCGKKRLDLGKMCKEGDLKEGSYLIVEASPEDRREAAISTALRSGALTSGSNHRKAKPKGGWRAGERELIRG